MGLDPDLLNDQDPFEIDEHNRPHLFKHHYYGLDDVMDLFDSDPLYFPAKEGGGADLLMVGEIPGEPPLVVPLAAAHSGDPSKARPIGIYQATGQLLVAYREAIRDAESRNR